MRMRALAALLLLLSAAGVACDEGGVASAPDDVPSFYARLEQALRREGAVAHLTITTSGSVDANPYATQEEIWLDVANDRARSELTTGFATAGEARAQVRIFDGRALYTEAEGVPATRNEAPVCRGAPAAAVAALLGCHGHLEAASVRVERSAFDGRATVALVAEGTAPRSEALIDLCHVLLNSNEFLYVD